MALSDLETALNRLDAKIAEVSSNPKPDYSIDGMSVSWGSYYSMLLESRKLLLEQIQLSSGPYEFTTQAIP